MTVFTHPNTLTEISPPCPQIFQLDPWVQQFWGALGGVMMWRMYMCVKRTYLRLRPTEVGHHSGVCADRYFHPCRRTYRSAIPRGTSVSVSRYFNVSSPHSMFSSRQWSCPPMQLHACTHTSIHMCMQYYTHIYST